MILCSLRKESVSCLGLNLKQKHTFLHLIAFLRPQQIIITLIYTEALRDLKRAMIEEVFGEFRPMIIEMRAALYDEDTSRVRRLLAEMEHSMFTDGI